ncbi:hypothetical protein OFAG_02289 [Oxalobacter formigenes HOxBLS]|uniref:Uncharacterized protein n=1 Tax=Oxalobacter paraformigenes TaxID=556268 RepID=T5LUM3_9BURK|nr:hypothetical protein OFAG_02289 [Oxalobacter paraformigenes]
MQTVAFGSWCSPEAGWREKQEKSRAGNFLQAAQRRPVFAGAGTSVDRLSRVERRYRGRPGRKTAQSNKTCQFSSAAARKHILICSSVFFSVKSGGRASGEKNALAEVS